MEDSKLKSLTQKEISNEEEKEEEDEYKKEYELLRSQFINILNLILPPCKSTEKSSSSSLTSSFNNINSDNNNINSDNNNNNNNNIEEESEMDFSDSSSLIEYITLLLATEIGIGGRIFNICTETFIKYSKEKYNKLQLILQSSLFAALTTYHCGNSRHIRETLNSINNNASLSLTQIPSQNENNNNNYCSLNSSCKITLLIRSAAILLGSNEAWWETSFSNDILSEDNKIFIKNISEVKKKEEEEENNNNNNNIVWGICEFVVTVAYKVALSQNNNNNNNNLLHTTTIDNIKDNFNLHKRQRDETSEEWIVIKEIENSQFKKHENTLNNIKVSHNEINNETLSTIGNVISALTEACESRTLVDISAWRYGRNKITLASMTVIMQEESNNNNNNNKLLGYYLHETGTLYTSSGENYFFEMN